VLTIRAGAGLLEQSETLNGLAVLASAIGFNDPPAPLDAAARARLGLGDSPISDAAIIAGAGALRALLVVLESDAEPRELVPRIAARLASRAPHVLWLVLATQPSRGRTIITAWASDKRQPRVTALAVDRARIVDSDAETVCALAAAASSRDVLTHARWVEVIGRDALTARFYRALERGVTNMAASSPRGNGSTRRELALLHTSRLLFLSFLEAKGWLDGNRMFLITHFDACLGAGGRFHDRVLRPLFFGTLNTPVSKRAKTAKAFGNIPFLNGGLFTPTALERKSAGVAFADDAYGTLLYDLFAQYRFTAREESTDWSEAAIDPEMLGRAFESLMGSGERRNTGAFYTPFSLVEQITARALEPCGESVLPTVLDPACGSGAFLVHALERIAERQLSQGAFDSVSAARRAVLTRCIFGVDLNPTAVWLCQLRLWLSVVIDSDETDPSSVVPLPNLDRNIRVGDALLGDAFDNTQPARAAAPIRRLRERYARATGQRKASLARQLDRTERRLAIERIDRELESIAQRRRDLVSVRRGRDLFGERYVPTRDTRLAAAELRRRAAALRAERKSLGAGAALPFAFATHFADVASRGGFDVVVGNPPWVRMHNVAPERREQFRRAFEVARASAWESGAANAGASRGFAAQVDVAAIFVERSVRLLGDSGSLALLVPAKLWRSLAGGGVRRLLTSDARLTRIEDFTEAASAFDAAVYPSLITATRAGATTKPCVHVAVHHRGHSPFEWTTSAESLPFDESSGAPWLLLPPEARRAFDAIRAAGVPLSESRMGRPLLGVKCGCNDAFLVELVSLRKDVAEFVSADGVAGEIERSLIRPLLRGEHLQRWRVPERRDAIIWTHDAGESPLAKLPPLAQRWFTRWRPSLVARSDARHSARWWSLFRTASAGCDRPRVVWGDVGREPRASVLPAGDARVPLNSCYVLRCPDDTDAHAFAALLNSPVARAWLDTLAEPARGGYRRYLGWTLSLLPFPHAWNDVRETLAAIGRRGANGEPVSDSELLEAAASAYALDCDTVAPLVAWMSER
jgi:hypothetical protein